MLSGRLLLEMKEVFPAPYSFVFVQLICSDIWTYKTDNRANCKKHSVCPVIEFRVIETLIDTLLK